VRRGRNVCFGLEQFVFVGREELARRLERIGTGIDPDLGEDLRDPRDRLRVVFLLVVDGRRGRAHDRELVEAHEAEHVQRVGLFGHRVVQPPARGGVARMRLARRWASRSPRAGDRSRRPVPG
jgi:hypothetical protein